MKSLKVALALLGLGFLGQGFLAIYHPEWFALPWWSLGALGGISSFLSLCIQESHE